MKIKKGLFLFAFVVFAISLNAQDNVIKANPIGLAFGNFNATYERVLNDKTSVLIDANYRYSLFGLDVSAFGVGAAYRFYITNAKKPVPAGFYAQGQAGFNLGSIDTFKYTSIAIGAQVGYQWVWDSGFVLDLGLGPVYTILSGETDSFGSDSGGGILPSFTLAVGYAF